MCKTPLKPEAWSLVVWEEAFSVRAHLGYFTAILKKNTKISTLKTCSTDGLMAPYFSATGILVSAAHGAAVAESGSYKEFLQLGLSAVAELACCAVPCRADSKLLVLHCSLQCMQFHAVVLG